MAPVLLVTAFAFCIGHWVWCCFLGPPVQPKYALTSSTSLKAPEGGVAQLYLRKEVVLPRRPRRAWIQVLGTDSIHVYVNGLIVDQKESDGLKVGIVADLTRQLQAGVNTVAILVQQRATAGKEPVVAVNGACLLDGEPGGRPLWTDNAWRCSTTFEHGAGGWWFSSSFHDKNWPLALVADSEQRATTTVPPLTRTALSGGQWLTAPALGDRCAAFRREFEITGRPRQAWMRLTACSPFRLAINGVLLDEREEQLGTMQRGAPLRCNYDISRFVQSGNNVLCVLVQDIAGPAHLMADVEVQDTSGGSRRFDTGEQWLVCGGTPKGWLDSTTDQSIDWLPCRIEAGDFNLPPWLISMRDVDLALPLPVVAQQVMTEAAVIVAVGLLTALACFCVGRFVAIPGLAGTDRANRAALASIALLLPIVLLTAAYLVSFDSRVLTQDVFRPVWLCLAVLLVPLQWAMFIALLKIRSQVVQSARGEEARSSAARYAMVLTVVCLTVVGFWLRFRTITDQPLHADEVTLLNFSKGWLTSGFPSMEIRKDLPRYYICGCELESLGTALASLVFTKDVFIVRVPTVLCGTLMIVLMAFVGSRLFNPTAGLISAALYALSPYCIDVSNFGRYQSQLQIFALLTTYCFWRAICGAGPVSRRYVCLAGLSFVALFLSWEASAFMAPGLVVFAILYRRGSLRAVLTEPVVWGALAVVAAIVVLQQSHNRGQLSQFLVEGTGWGDVRPTLMWKYPFFKPWRYLFNAAWCTDGLFADVGVLAAMLFAVRHRWCHPLRLLLICLITTCLSWALLIPLVASRYSYMVVPHVILLSSAGVAAGIEVLIPQAVLASLPTMLRIYARGLSIATTAILIAIGCGSLLDLREMHGQVAADIPRYGLKHPNLESVAAYIGQHYQPGDIVIASQPEVFDHYGILASAGWSTPLVCDYGLETILQLYMLMPDSMPTPVHRFSGTPMIPNLESLRAILTRNKRVWYVAISGVDEFYNNGETLSYLGQNMDVVFQDFQSTALLRDMHRPASVRQIEQQELHKALVDVFH